jgi:hypothetical protein
MDTKNKTSKDDFNATSHKTDVICRFSIGSIVPYINSAGRVREAEITEFKDTNTGIWFYGIDTKTKAKVWYSVSKSEKLHNISLNEMACYNGCITEDGHNLTCGDKYEYNGILSKKEREMYPRKQSTTLRYLPLIKVECDSCKRIKFDQLLLKNGR